MSDVLVTVRCRIHRHGAGVLRDHPNGFRQYRATNIGIHARNRRLLGRGDTTMWNFHEPSDYARDIQGWCRTCGEEPRVFQGSRLLAAVEAGKKSIFV